jgi:hypothetical protein
MLSHVMFRGLTRSQVMLVGSRKSQPESNPRLAKEPADAGSALASRLTAIRSATMPLRVRSRTAATYIVVISVRPTPR